MEFYSVTSKDNKLVRICETYREAELVQASIHKVSKTLPCKIEKLNKGAILNYLEMSIICEEDTQLKQELLAGV